MFLRIHKRTYERNISINDPNVEDTSKATHSLGPIDSILFSHHLCEYVLSRFMVRFDNVDNVDNIKLYYIILYIYIFYSSQIQSYIFFTSFLNDLVRIPRNWKVYLENS